MESNTIALIISRYLGWKRKLWTYGFYRKDRKLNWTLFLGHCTVQKMPQKRDISFISMQNLNHPHHFIWTDRKKLFVENRKLRLSYFCYTIPFRFSEISDIFHFNGVETPFSGGFKKLENVCSIFSLPHYM